MKTVRQNTFGGGLAEDVKELKSNTFSCSQGFDISGDVRLTPYRGTETESIDTGSLSDARITDVVIMKDATNTNIFALGRTGSGNNYPKFFQKATVMDVTSAFQAAPSGADTVNNVIPGTLVEYKNRLFCLKETGTTALLMAYNRVGASLATIATISAYPQVTSGAAFPKPYRHPKDDNLYFASGNVLSKYDNSTVTNPLVTLPTDCYITSLTEYNSYLAILTAPTTGGGRSKLFFYDVSRALTTFQDVVDLGEGQAKIIENINNTLVIVMSNQTPTSNSVFNLNTVLSIKTWSGTLETVKEFKMDNGSLTLPNFKAQNKNVLYFACKATINGTAVNQIWEVGKVNGRWYVTPSQLANNSTALTGNVNGLSMIGDILWVAFNDDGTFFRTVYSSATYPTATFETLINPNMEAVDRAKKKKLVSISVSKPTSTGTITGYYSVDGASYVSFGSTSTLLLNASAQNDGQPFEAGFNYKLKFESTTGAEITEYVYTYEILNELN